MVLNRSGVAGLVVLAGALAFVILACGGGKPDPAERWPDLGVPEAEFVFVGDVTEDEQESIRRELKAAQVVYAEHFGAVSSGFTVYIGADFDLLDERLAADRSPVASITWQLPPLRSKPLELDTDRVPRAPFTCNGGAVRGVIVIVIEGCREEFRGIGANLAGVYFFILQWQAGTVSFAEGSLRWFPLASAVYANALVDDAQGRRPLEVRRKGEQILWSSLGEPFLQGDSESHVSGVGFLAVEWLVERAGSDAVLKLFRLGAHRASFETAFGMSLDAFHEAFERHRSQVAPPFAQRAAGKVVGEGGEAIERAYVSAVVRIEGEAWPTGRDHTDTQGGFEFAAPGSGYTIAVWLQCPSGEGVLGEWVHVGEWGADGFLADADGYLEDHQEGPEPLADGERDRTDLVIEVPETRESLVEKHCEP